MVTVGRRPILVLSFALNYAVFGPEPWGYHLVNLVIHIGAGLLLFGIVRKTIQVSEERKEASCILDPGSCIAFCIALIWVVHPLNTGAVTYISPEMALREFSGTLGEDADLLELLDGNPLPPSYHLELTAAARNLDAVRAIRDEVAGWAEVDEIVFHQDWIDALERWTFRFQMASMIVSLIVFVAAVSVISNTVKLTMAASARVI